MIADGTVQFVLRADICLDRFTTNSVPAPTKQLQTSAVPQVDEGTAQLH
jgi:hypothetical protein